MNIRELIEHLTELATELPGGDDSEVRVHLCRGHDEVGEITKKVTVDSDGTRALVHGHPHLDEGSTVARPVTLGVDDELARLVSGEEPAPAPSPRPMCLMIATGDSWARELPLDPDGTPLVPGSLDAIARGCRCDPGRNRDGAGHDTETGRIFVFHDDCSVHRRVRLG